MYVLCMPHATLPHATLSHAVTSLISHTTQRTLRKPLLQVHDVQFMRDTRTIHARYTHDTRTIHARYTHDTRTIQAPTRKNTRKTIHTNLIIFQKTNKSKNKSEK